MLLVAGCGDDDAPIEPISTETTTSSSATLSQDEFIVSADARCAEANLAIANLSGGTGSSTSGVSQRLEITQGVLDGLQDIGEAEDPGGSLASYYAALEDQIAILEEQEAAIAGGDTAAADLLGADLSAAEAEAEDAALAYGFEDCGGSGTTLPETGVETDAGATVTPAPVEPPATPAPVEPVTPAPVEPVPVEPVPVEPPPAPSGGTGGGTGSPAPPAGSGGSSGGISP